MVWLHAIEVPTNEPVKLLLVVLLSLALYRTESATSKKKEQGLFRYRRTPLKAINIPMLQWVSTGTHCLMLLLNSRIIVSEKNSLDMTKSMQ